MADDILGCWGAMAGCAVSFQCFEKTKNRLMYVDFHATFSSDFCGFEWIWGVTKVPGIGPTRGAALLRLGVSI